MYFCLYQIANCGPADYNYDETISTLRYANRAKNIQNKAVINEDPKDALLRQFQKEIEELRRRLEDGGGEKPSGARDHFNLYLGMLKKRVRWRRDVIKKEVIDSIRNY